MLLLDGGFVSCFPIKAYVSYTTSNGIRFSKKVKT